MYSVVFVCTGNTCRSPMAEAIARRLWGDGGGVEFSSAGVAATGGAPASPHADDVSGGALADHRSRPADPDVVASADLLVGLTRRHRDHLLAHHPAAAGRVVTLGELAGQPGDIPDPFGQDRAAYAATHAKIEELLKAALPALRARAAAAGRP